MVPTEKDDLVEHLKYWAFKFCGRGDKENIASDVMTEAWEEIERLRGALRDIYEVYAGSEGIPKPMTAAEGYLLQQLMEAVRIAARALAGKIEEAK
jgi:hypothetical protein